MDADIVYGKGVFIGHRYYEMLNHPPRFYFGHGLSYTTFEYSNLEVPPVYESDPKHIMTISVSLKNTGQCPGAEIVQVYVKDVSSSVQRPRKELKSFKKVHLAPGENMKIEVTS